MTRTHGALVSPLLQGIELPAIGVNGGEDIDYPNHDGLVEQGCLRATGACYIADTLVVTYVPKPMFLIHQRFPETGP